MTRFAVALVVSAAAMAQIPPTGLEDLPARVRGYRYLVRGYQAEKDGKLPEARDSFRIALEIQPGNAAAHRQYITILYKLKAYDEAIAAIDRWLLRHPDDGTLLLYRAMSLDAMGDKSAPGAYRVALRNLTQGPQFDFARKALKESILRQEEPLQIATAPAVLPARIFLPPSKTVSAIPHWNGAWSQVSSSGQTLVVAIDTIEPPPVEVALTPLLGEPLTASAEEFRSAGYTAAERGDSADAIEYWSVAQTLSPTAIVAVRLASMRLKLGKDVTLSEIDTIPAAGLTGMERVEYLDVRAAVLEKSKAIPDAVQLYEEANAAARNSERSLHLAGLHRQLGRTDEAIDEYESVLAGDSKNADAAAGLAYALISKERSREAIRVLEQTSRTPQLEAQLGYLYRSESRNEEAIRSFDAALPLLDKPEAKRVAWDRYFLASNFSWNAYWTFASPGLQDSSFLGTGYGSAVPSQGGAEVSWRPPKIGYRNDRIFALFARVMWANQPKSAAIAADSWQGGVGARYKPLRKENLFLSGERLVQLGSNALNSWLFRSSYSTNHGDTPWRVSGRTSYTTLFVDTALYTATPQTWLYFVQGRQGISLRMGRRVLVSPHGMFELRYQDRSQQRVGYGQGGAGVALNIGLQRDPELPGWGKVEVLMQYRTGGFFERHPALAPRDSFSGWFGSVALLR